jgi:L-2-hydroxyglutarate oxidase LhgO
MLTPMDKLDTVVVGAGVVGLAVARALAQAGRSVWLLERAEAFGTGVSARSSEVIHGGLYYAAGSLKARWCVAGRRALYAYAHERGVPHRRTGKLIVATADDQLPGLQALLTKAQTNGVENMAWLDAAQACAMEPALHCVGALWSPQTGIVDSHALMLSLLGDAERAGATLVCHTGVLAIRRVPDGWKLRLHDGTEILAERVVNAAGLGAVALAQRSDGIDPALLPRAHFAKGSYFSLAGKAPFSRLIYPAPMPGLAGLGVHLTLDMGGQARFGPDVQWLPSPAAGEELPTTDPALWAVDPARAALFAAEVRRYWPGVPTDRLQPAYVGIRPKISGPGEPATDFCLLGPSDHGAPGLVHLLGMESPGLTSCLAVGAAVAQALA